VIELASRYQDVAIVSRGYGRESSGLVEVSRRGEILCDVRTSGDEPMLMAKALGHADVIVSEDRKTGIRRAVENGAKLVILDDGFSRVDIEKFEILLEPEDIHNFYPFPAGPFREFVSTRSKADIIVKEGREYQRIVEIDNPAKRMVLVSAIANPQRLERYLPGGVVAKVFYEDHAYFEEHVLQDLLREHQADSILCTSKDRIKMGGFKLPVSEMKLKLEIKNEVMQACDAYIEGYKR
jgi:tetraacyldisaccharide 4'-kinase